MDDHPPSWETNGVDYLCPFGVRSTDVTHLNMFLRQAKYAAPKEVNIVRLSAGLVDNYSISSLELHNCGITTESMNALAQAISVNKYITYLGVSRNRFYTKGGIALAEALKINQTVNTIDLGWNELRDSFAGSIAEAIAVNNSLQRIILDRNKITSDGVSAISFAMQKNKKVRYLGLSGNCLTGAACSFIGQMLALNETLLTLDISLNGIQTEGMISLFTAINTLPTCNLTTINVGGNNIGDGIVTVGHALSKLPALRELNLSFSYLEKGPALVEFAKMLKSNNTICNISFAYNPKLGDEGIQVLCEALTGLCLLRFLDFSDTMITSAIFPHIRSLLRSSNISTLHLSQNNLGGNSMSGKNLLEAILACPSLTFLGLMQCKIRQEQAISLFSSPLSLRGITIRNNNIGPDTVNKVLQRCMYSKLNYIDVSGNQTDATVLPLLRDLFESNKSLPYVVLEDDTVLDRNRLKLIHWSEISGKTPPLAEHAAPPLCVAKLDIQRFFPPTAGFANYSITQGSCMSRHHDCSDVLLTGLLNLAGLPVKHCYMFERDKTGPTPSLRLKNGVMLDNILHPKNVNTYENNIGGLLVSDDQLRREFNRLDVNGDGYLRKNEFKNVYSSFEHFGLGHLSHQDLDRALFRFSVDDKISFNEFCIVMLRLVQH